MPLALVRLGARQVSRRVLNPRLPWDVQRRRLDRLVGPWPLPRGTSVRKSTWNGVPGEVVTAGPSAVTVVHFHGGGYCVGSPAEARDWAAHLITRTGCRVILPEYRLAPEHPYPAALDDCYAALQWVVARGDIDSQRIVVAGVSAGAGLAAALTLRCVDSRLVDLAGQALMCPMLDDRTVRRTTVAGARGWTPEDNAFGWRSYLGSAPGIEGVSDASTATYSSGEFCLWVDFHSDPILGSLLVSNQTSLLSKMV